MAVLKYRNENGEFIDVLVPVTVFGEPIEPEVPVEPEPPAEPVKASVIMPNLYHNSVGDQPMSAIEYNVEGFNTLTFDYVVSQESPSSSARTTAFIEVLFGANYITQSGSFKLNNTSNYEYIVRGIKTEVEGTYTVDITDYNTVVVRVTSNNTTGYSAQAGYILIHNIVLE